MKTRTPVVAARAPYRAVIARGPDPHGARAPTSAAAPPDNAPAATPNAAAAPVAHKAWTVGGKLVGARVPAAQILATLPGFDRIDHATLGDKTIRQLGRGQQEYFDFARRNFNPGTAY